MSMSGSWALHYSWGCSAQYAQSTITFHPNGTFGGTHKGKWRQRDGTLLLSFDAGPATYGGTVDGHVGSGAMSTFAGLNGCWYLTRQGTTGLADGQAPRSTRHSHDPAGNAV